MTLEDCARNVPKRVSKLENFLRKRLSEAELSGLRYYEVCVSETKGALFVRYIILTGDSILMTENPPKDILLIIRLSQIRDISLVADRGSLVTGSQGNTPFICRHIRVVYVDDFSDKIKGKRGKTIKDEEGHENSGSGSSCSSNEETSSRLSAVTEMSLLGGVENDDHHSQDARPRTPSFLQEAYDPFNSHGIHSGFSLGSDDLISMGKTKEQTGNRNTTMNGRSSPYDRDDSDDIKSLESVSTTISLGNSDELNLPSTNVNTNKNLLGVGKLPDRASSVLDDRKSSHWQNGSVTGDGDDSDLKKRPQSIDISQLSTLRNKFIPSYFSRHHSNNKLEAETRPQYTMATTKKAVKREPKFKVLELNFYLYQQRSSLLNELYLVWNRSKLQTHELGRESIFSLSETSEAEEEQVYNLRAAEKVMSLITKQKVLTRAKYFGEFSRLLPILCSLQQNLVKYHHLRRLCWKDTKLIRDLMEMIRRSVCPEEEDVEEESESRLVERITVFSVLMDIFRLLFESCSTSFFVQSSATDRSLSPVHLNHTVTTTSLIRLLFTYPLVSQRMPGRVKILRVIFDPQTFAKCDWMNCQETNVIGALTVAHNASAALLYEIMSLFYYSPRDNEKITFISLVRKYSLESYVKQSVTQIINLLWSSRAPLRAYQCSLLYRHVYILKILLDNLPTVKNFVSITFCEEFQYFVHWNCINMKISDQYPIKSKLSRLFEELRGDIIRNGKDVLH